MPNSQKLFKYFQSFKKISTSHNLCKSSRERIGLILTLAGAIALSHHSVVSAQTAIDSLTGSYEPGTSTSYSTTTADPCDNPYSPCNDPIDMDFGVGANSDLRVTGFTSGGASYSLVNLADEIKFQRIDGQGATGERQLMLFERDPDDADATIMRSSYTNNMETALLNDIANRGIDNAFSNDDDVASNNIERIDYIISNGLDIPTDVRNDIGFLILERGGNDPFKIAAITSLDANGNPASFAPLQNVTAGTWGASGYSIETSVMRREENEPNFRPSHTVGNQDIEGIYISLSDLNVPAEQLVYGYALFPNDITATSSNDLVNLTGFSTTTSGGSGQGGLDLMAGGGIYLADNLNVVSGTLYEDANTDDSFNSGEATLPNGIEVILYQDTNSNGEYDSGEEVQTSGTSRGNGGYNFIGVADGTYRVFVDTNDPDVPSNLVLGTPNNTEVVVSGSDQTGINFGFDTPPAATVICPTESSSTGSGYATSGTGQYKNDIFWLDWSCGSTTQFNPGDIVQKTWTGFHGIEITATINNITEAVEPYNTGQWRGDRLDELYGGVNPIGLTNLNDSEDPTYDITFSMTLNGVPIPADIVTAEAEDTNTTNESATWTTDGTPWQPLEAAPNSSLEVAFSNGGQTLTMEDRSDGVDGGGVVIALTENVSTISTQMFAGGKEAIAFGIMTPFDFGDADGYPTSGGHLARRTATGGSQPTTSTPVNDLTMATLLNNSPYLGSNGPDIDPAETSDIATVDADGDDRNTLDDEDAFDTLPTLSEGDTSYTIATNDITANTTGVATLHAWVDFNKNSDFEPGEYQSVEVNNGTPADDLTWSNLSGITSGITYARFRITTDSNIDDTTPYASAIDGEMEDYQLAIADGNRPLGSAFTCDSTFYITIGEGGNNPPAPQFLYAVNRSGSTYDFGLPIGPSTSEANGYTNDFRYNALAYNPVDNYLYAIVQVDSTSDPDDPYSVNNIVKIGSDGILHSIGIPEESDGSLLNSTGYFAATALSDGTYIIGRNSGGNALFAKLDVTTTPPTILSQGSISGASFTDFAVDPTDPTSTSGARVYGIEQNDNRLVVLDLTDTNPKINVTLSADAGDIGERNAGSQFVDSFGTLYYRSNTDDKLYRVDSDPSSDTYGKDEEITTGNPGGNHDGASCLFASAMEKEIQDLEGNPLPTITENGETRPTSPAGETVRYVYTIASGNTDDLTGVTFTDDLRNAASGDPINGTFTGNVTVDGVDVSSSADVSFSNDNQTIEITNLTIPEQAGGRPGETLTVTAEVKVPSTLAVGDYYNQAFIRDLPPIYPPAIASDYPPSAAYEDPTPLSVTADLLPDLLLVKRITAINPGQSNEVLYDEFVDDATTDEPTDIDNDPNWSDPDTYLPGAISVDNIQPGDEVEYTIYFLSNGEEEATNVQICDVIPDNMTFVPDSYATGSGIAFLNSSDFTTATATNLTNADDTDGDTFRGRFYAPGTPLPTVTVTTGDPPTTTTTNLCKKIDSAGNTVEVNDTNNTNGAVVVGIDEIPDATAPEEPDNAYGFIRFRARVQ